MNVSITKCRFYHFPLTFKSFVVSPSITAAGSKFKSAVRSASVKLTNPLFCELINEFIRLLLQLFVEFWLLLILLCCGELWLLLGELFMLFDAVWLEPLSLWFDGTLGGPPGVIGWLPEPPPGVWGVCGVWGICNELRKLIESIHVATFGGWEKFTCSFNDFSIAFNGSREFTESLKCAKGLLLGPYSFGLHWFGSDLMKS